MKEKNIKFILELIFIFILPLCLLATCFKQEKVYDENNNEVGKYLSFDNIFILSEEQVTYYNYEYYEHNEALSLSYGDSFYVNYNISPFVNFNSNDVIFINSDICVYFVNDLFSLSDNNSVSVLNDEYYVVIYRKIESNAQVINKFDNIIKEVHTYTIGNNVVNRLLNFLYDSLGITSNWILQFIVIYTLLWLIMWFIWHILYLPLDFICSKLLFDRVDK